MISSPSRMIRPRSFWGSAVAGLALTFVVPASADDAARAEKPAAPVTANKAPGKPGEKPAGLKTSMEGRKERVQGAKGDERPTTAGRPQMGKSDKADRPGKGPAGKDRKGTKRRPAPTPKMAMSQYGKAIAELRQAEAAAESAGPEETAKAKKELKAAQRAVRRAENSIRSAHRKDAMKILNMNPEERKKLDLKLQVRAKKLAADRKERAQKRQDELKKELGAKVTLPPVRAELERHAWRVARLERLAAIAEAAGRPEAATRAKELLEKEMAAHPLRLKKAASGKAQTGSPRIQGTGASPKSSAAPVPKNPAPVTNKPATVPNQPAALPAKEPAQ